MARVLIVDADSRVRASLRGILERRRHEVYETANAPDGVAAAKRLAVHVVFADVQHTTVHGADLITELRVATSVPIVAMAEGRSARSVASLAAAVNLGASGFLLKPFTIDDVVAVLQETLPPA